MKTLKLFVLALALLANSHFAVAQVTTAQIREQIANGECETAQSLYNVYKAMNGSDKTIERMIAECGDEQTSVSGTVNGHDYVDLGLPSGTLWATCNVGASKPEGYGNYYAWGETETKTTYDWDTYKYANGDYNKLTKYCNKSYYGNNGFTDKLTTLQAGDDPAMAAWGSGWHTPDKKQWEELLDNTTNKWMTQNGVQGRLFTSKKNGQTLFLPAAGGRWGSELDYAGSRGDYWSRSLDTDGSYYALGLRFDSGDCYMGYLNRGNGRSVRPVRSARQN